MIKHEKTFIILITLAAILNYAATEIYLPALPALKVWFNTSISQLQFTISIFFLGSAIAQFITGPIIDRFSYRKTALSACAAFILASLICALSTDILEFTFSRLLQAFATGTLAIVARASLIKTFSAEKTMHIYLYISPALALSLSFSPFIGGYLSYYLGWQSVFYFLTGVGIILLILIIRHLHISQKKHELISINPASICKTYFSLLDNKLYIACIFGLGAALAQIAAFLTESPFLFYKLGYTSAAIGKFYILYAFAFVIGSYITRKMINRIKFKTLIYFGFANEFLCIVILFTISFTHIKYAYEIFMPTFFSGIGNGILVALLTAKAITLFKQKAGYASGFASSAAFFFSTLSSAFVNYFTRGDLRFLVIYMFAIISIGLIGFYIFSQKATSITNQSE